MMSYCSLQEAWEMPMFLKRRKNEKDPKDPKEPRPIPSNLAPAPPRYSREDFSTTSDLPEYKKNYTTEQEDRRYYCKTYGVCAGDIKETFTGSTSPAAMDDSCGLPNVNYDYPLSNTDKEKFKKAMDTATDGEDAKPPKKGPFDTPRQGSSSRVSGYYDEEIEDYLETNDIKYARGEPVNAPYAKSESVAAALASSTPTPTPTPLGADAKTQLNGPPVSATYGIPVLTPDIASVPQKLGAAPVATAAGTGSGSKTPWQNILDLILFIGVGILTIFMMEQMYRIAVLVGMRQTMHALEPFIMHVRD
jgi:hypothetical protein